ncbi:hypothetical protein [Psychromonas sp. SP041]|uniref:hypothetical protein n=1 Tax=Psychromonas sp. SP041 TaxID=1365007 RepID=UPI0010C7D3D5|nr:hypothetical protein [Psychromonas sp. SP041]
MFHASRKRFEKFDLSFVGTGQEVNRYAFGIYLGEADNVSSYLETYQHFDETDKSHMNKYGELVDENEAIESYNGVCYRASIRNSDLSSIKKWNENVDEDVLNSIAVELYNKLGHNAQIGRLSNEIEDTGLNYEISDDIETFIDNTASHLEYELMSTSDVLIDSDDIKDLLYRKLRGDDVTEKSSDEDFIDILDEKTMSVFDKVIDNDLTINNDFDYGDLYRAISIAFTTDEGKLNSVEQALVNEANGKKKASSFLCKQGISGFYASSLNGKSGASELIITDEELASRIAIKEVSKSELDYEMSCSMGY